MSNNDDWAVYTPEIDIEEEEPVVYLVWEWQTLRADATPYKVYGYELVPHYGVTVRIPIPLKYVLVPDDLNPNDVVTEYNCQLTMEGFLWVNQFMAQSCLKWRNENGLG